MKTRILTLIFAVMVFCGGMQVSYGQDISGTFSAKGLLEFKNISPSDVLFQELEGPDRGNIIINTLLQSKCSELLAEQLFSQYGGDYPDKRFFIHCDLVTWTKVEGQNLYNYLYELNAEIHDGTDTAPVAIELRDATVRWLDRFISIRHAETMDEINDRLVTALNNEERFKIKLKGMQAEQQALIKEGGRGVLSRSRVQDELRSLRREKQSVELDLQGMKARSEALQEQIVKVGEQAEEIVGQDSILVELEKILDFKKQALSRAIDLDRQAAIAKSELNKYREEVARAQIEVAQRREQIGKKALGGDMLSQWNMELADIAIRLAEKKAHFGYLAYELANMEDNNLMELADRIEQLEMEINNARNTVYEATREVEQIRREMQRIREPKVALLGNN